MVQSFIIYTNSEKTLKLLVQHITVRKTFKHKAFNWKAGQRKKRQKIGKVCYVKSPFRENYSGADPNKSKALNIMLHF